MHYIIKPSTKYNNSIQISFILTLETLKNQKNHGIELYMPRHIAGSYMMRDFARHIININANDNLGNSIFIQKTGISEWYIDFTQIINNINHIEISYHLFATDKSVRGNYIDDERMLINGSASFIYPKNLDNIKNNKNITLEFQSLEEFYSDYQIFTTLEKTTHHNQFLAQNFEELCDTPIIIAKQNSYITNKNCDNFINNDYNIVFTGDIPHNIDMQKINADIHKICHAQDKFFDCKNEYKTTSMQDYKYMFMTHIAQDSYGGLEHKASTVLACSPESLCIKSKSDENALNAKYIEFLGLCSHEYFHSWWVKRVKPQAFIHANTQQEFDTSLLWIFEGFTSYYDDLFLCKTNIINKDKYLKLIENNINNIYKTTAHYEQNLYESSCDAWIKYYQPNENSHNVNISYYVKGSLVALCLDLHIRIHTQHQKSLDNVMLFMFNKYGRNFYTTDNKTGITYQSFIQDIQEVTGLDIEKLLSSWVFSTDKQKELPFIEYLQHFSINCSKTVEYNSNWGIQYNKNQTFVNIDKINNNGLAYRAKLMAGDILISVNNIMILSKDADEIFDRINKSEDMSLQYIRNRQLKEIVIKYEDMQHEKFILNIEKDYNLENMWPC
ncbi:MAG: hypothetical protein RLZZ210_961 [Pseudomonadota bacterium]|jgi:predicted metalloprotease with PDZ domain